MNVKPSGQHLPRQRAEGILFIGNSGLLNTVADEVERYGIDRVETPHPAMACAVADEDVLDGMCTSVEAAQLQRVRALGLPCLTPDEARAFLGLTEAGSSQRPTSTAFAMP